MRIVNITTDYVKLLGRTYQTEHALWLTLSGSGIEFTYTGRNLTLTVCGREAASLPNNQENYARIAVYVNGTRTIDDCLDCPERTYQILEEAETQTVTIKVVKLSECAMSVCGLVHFSMDDDGTMSPVPAKSRRIEFIGDSITCGYGIDDENCEHHFLTATEDATKAYAYKTAQELEADYSLFSISGYGIISGYTDDRTVKRDDQQLPPYYKSQGFSRDTFDDNQLPEQISWNFDSFRPDMVVINLGTNDDSYCQDDIERQEEYSQSYEAFLAVVREANPDAVILCVLGLMGSRLYPFICKACERFQARTGDQKLYHLQLPEQDGNVGYVADYHPLECFHDAAVTVLAQEIRRIMDWK